MVTKQLIYFIGRVKNILKHVVYYVLMIATIFFISMIENISEGEASHNKVYQVNQKTPSKQLGYFGNNESYFSIKLWYDESGTVLYFPANDRKAKLWIDSKGVLHFSQFKDSEWKKKMSSQRKMTPKEWYEIGLGLNKNYGYLFIDWNKEDGSLNDYSYLWGEVILLGSTENGDVDKDVITRSSINGKVKQFTSYKNYPPVHEKEKNVFKNYPWHEVLTRSFLTAIVVALLVTAGAWWWLKSLYI